MRLRGEITINSVKPITKELVTVSFNFENKSYQWSTSTWKTGNPITYAVKGEKFKVSFKVVGDYTVKKRNTNKMIYTVTKIESKPRSFLKALNHGLKSNVNEVTIYMKKKADLFYPLDFWPFNWIVKYKAEGIVGEDVNINDYLKIGDQFDASQYPTLKISKL